MFISRRCCSSWLSLKFQRNVRIQSDSFRRGFSKSSTVKTSSTPATSIVSTPTFVAPCGTHHLDCTGKPLYAYRFKEVFSYHSIVPDITKPEKVIQAAAIRTEENLCYHIDKKGNPLYDARFTRTFGFYCSLAAVQNDCQYAYHIKPDGKPAYQHRFSWVGNYNRVIGTPTSALCPVKSADDGLYYYINEHGGGYDINEIGENENENEDDRLSLGPFSYAGDFNNQGEAVVWNLEGEPMVIDSYGNQIYITNSQDSNTQSSTGLISSSTKQKILNYKTPHKKIVTAYDDNGWFFLPCDYNRMVSNSTTNHIATSTSPPTISTRRYREIEPFYNGHAFVQLHNGNRAVITDKYYYIDSNINHDEIGLLSALNKNKDLTLHKDVLYTLPTSYDAIEHDLLSLSLGYWDAFALKMIMDSDILDEIEIKQQQKQQQQQQQQQQSVDANIAHHSGATTTSTEVIQSSLSSSSSSHSNYSSPKLRQILLYVCDELGLVTNVTTDNIDDAILTEKGRYLLNTIESDIGNKCRYWLSDRFLKSWLSTSQLVFGPIDQITAMAATTGEENVEMNIHEEEYGVKKKRISYDDYITEKIQQRRKMKATTSTSGSTSGSSGSSTSAGATDSTSKTNKKKVMNARMSYTTSVVKPILRHDTMTTSMTTTATTTNGNMTSIPMPTSACAARHSSNTTTISSNSAKTEPFESVVSLHGPPPFTHTAESDYESSSVNQSHSRAIKSTPELSQKVLNSYANADWKGITSKLPLQNHQTIIDIGGGLGSLLCKIKEEYNSTTATSMTTTAIGSNVEKEKQKEKEEDMKPSSISLKLICMDRPEVIDMALHNKYHQLYAINKQKQSQKEFQKKKSEILKIEEVNEEVEEFVEGKIEEVKDILFVRGDMFFHIPPGGHVYLLSRVLHDWNDYKASMILRNIFKSMSPKSKIIIIDRVVTNDCKYGLLSLHMYLLNGGYERSHREWIHLFHKNGFMVSDEKRHNEYTLFTLVRQNDYLSDHEKPSSSLS